MRFASSVAVMEKVVLALIGGVTVVGDRDAEHSRHAAVSFARCPAESAGGGVEGGDRDGFAGVQGEGGSICPASTSVAVMVDPNSAGVVP